METIWIIGAGQFGMRAVTSLSRRHKNLKIVLVDQDCEKLDRARGMECITVHSDGGAYLETHLKPGNLPDWIVPALPVHLVWEWCLRQLGPEGLTRVNISSEIDGQLPNPMHGSNGDIYVSHANFILEERMAETPEKVYDFLKELLIKAKPAAKQEFKELSEFAKELDAIEQLESWDGSFYSEKLKQKRFSLDDEKLKPYFKLENVIEGVFMITGRLYGLSFEEVFDVDKYHPEVKTYRIYDSNNKFVSLFYADFHPREGKRAGAWMTSFKPQFIMNNKNERPQVSNVCNFTKPTENKPSLLTFNEVTTLFHEFGHALHGILANTIYPSLSGTSVYWDFVELPSQILENWCYEKEALEVFARHYETEEPIPMSLVESIKESATFQEGMATMRQLSFGFLDMSWHASDPSVISDVKKHEVKAFEDTLLYPNNPETCMSVSFAHIFQGGYSAGYYSYKWAEVLDADAFDYFKEKGIFNREVAEKFKDHILSKGGTEKPMVLYKRFRGREPKIEALLERAGLMKKTA